MKPAPYSTITLNVMPNCIYQFYSKISINKKDIIFSVNPYPASQAGSPECGVDAVTENKRQDIIPKKSIKSDMVTGHWPAATLIRSNIMNQCQTMPEIHLDHE